MGRKRDRAEVCEGRSTCLNEPQARTEYTLGSFRPHHVESGYRCFVRGWLVRSTPSFEAAANVRSGEAALRRLTTRARAGLGRPKAMLTAGSRDVCFLDQSFHSNPTAFSDTSQSRVMTDLSWAWVFRVPLPTGPTASKRPVGP